MQRVLSLCLVALFPLVALLQAPHVASAQVAPDVVITDDGGMMRGSIVESVPGDHVTITLSNGESRVVPWANVEYAGPESDRPRVSPRGVPAPPAVAPPVVAPTPSAAYGSASPSEVHVRVTSDQENISLHEVTGTATASVWTGQGVATIRAFSFARLCGTPCTLSLPPGSHHFALSQGDGEAVPGPQLDLMGSGTLDVQYVDRSALRAAGWLTLIGGGLAGAAWMLVPIFASDNSDDWLLGLLGGGAVLLVSEIVGLILAMHGDGAEVRFD